jgi:hypothetical protein
MHPAIAPIFRPPQSNEKPAEYFPDLSMEQYRALPALNASTLKEETAAEMRAAQIGDEPKEMTESTASTLALGTCIHKAILEPDAFDGDDWKSWFHFSPTKGVTTKAALELQATLPPHITIITPEMLDKARRCRDVARKDADVCLLMKNADLELTGTAWDEKTKVRRKSRFDIRGGEGSNYLADIKSTQSLNLEAFTRQIRNLRWDIQAVYYLDVDSLIRGETRTNFYFIGITKEISPFLVRVFELPADMLADARTDYLERMAKFIKAAKTDTWPGYSGITTIPYHPYHKRA